MGIAQPLVSAYTLYCGTHSSVQLCGDYCVQLDVNYETTYGKSYGEIRDVSSVPSQLRRLKCKNLPFTRHQRENDSKLQ